MKNNLPFILWRQGDLVVGIPSSSRLAGTNIELPNLRAKFKTAVQGDTGTYWHEEDQEFTLKRIIAWGTGLQMLLIDALVNSIVNSTAPAGEDNKFGVDRLDLLSTLGRENEPLCILFLTDRGLVTVSEGIQQVWQCWGQEDDLYINTSEALYSVMNHSAGRESATIDLVKHLEGLGALGANIPSIDYIQYSKYDWNPNASIAADLGKTKPASDSPAV